MNRIPPIRREMFLRAPKSAVFGCFTDDIARWWPFASHSVFGDGSRVAFEPGALVEEGPSGERSVWAEVVAFEPPHLIRLNWHAGQPVDQATDVVITFSERDGGTLLALEHSGWERRANGAEMREGYQSGWGIVLGRLAEHVEAGAEGDSSSGAPDERWVVLVHTAGEASSNGTKVREHSDFAHHVDFLSRMADERRLVAAGPFGDGDGEGMTILRMFPGEDLEVVRRLAEQSDESVARGLLRVQVRPWHVSARG